MKYLPILGSAVLIATALVTIAVTWSPDPPNPESPDPQQKPEESTSIPETEPKEKTEPVVKETPKEPDPPKHDYYSKGKQSYDGTGKYYQGREIAYVMGHQAIPWLERENREVEEAPTKAIELIDLAKGQTLADIGAGSGYYSIRIAMKYSDSKVIGVDIQPEMIAFLQGRARQLGLPNLSAKKGTIENIGLAPASIDAALMVDAYHEFSHPYEMMTSIVRALKPGGRVYLLEYREEDESVQIKPRHKMSQAQAKKEMKLVGLKWEKTLDDLPWQHFMVFRKP